jgi:cytochrome P450
MTVKHGLPPGPPVPGLVQIAAAGLTVGMRFDPRALRLVQKVYGDMFTVRVPTIGKVVMVGSPELVRQVFAADPTVLHFGDPNPLGGVIGRQSMFSLDEREHMVHRKLLLPPFHGERMHTYEAIVVEETIREIESWPHGREFRTTKPFMRITLNIILRAIFGVHGGPHMEELLVRAPAAVKIGSRLVAVPPALRRDLGPWSPSGRFVRLKRRFEWGVNALVDQARRDPDVEQRTDVLALLAQARHDDGSLMTDEEIVDELATVMAAGHETTANSLAWTIERLRRHPEVLGRLVREADEGGKALREATIREVQRTRPVIPGTGRFVVKPFALGDYVLPPGCVVVVAAPLVHNDPRVYDNPRAFVPERFLNRRPDPNAWFPFGGGVRRCIGAAFAHMEMDIVLRTILQRLELETTSARGERWLFRGVAFAPAKGGVAVVHRRSAGAARQSLQVAA